MSFVFPDPSKPASLTIVCCGMVICKARRNNRRQRARRLQRTKQGAAAAAAAFLASTNTPAVVKVLNVPTMQNPNNACNRALQQRLPWMRRHQPSGRSCRRQRSARQQRPARSQSSPAFLHTQGRASSQCAPMLSAAAAMQLVTFYSAQVCATQGGALLKAKRRRTLLVRGGARNEVTRGMHLLVGAVGRGGAGTERQGLGSSRKSGEGGGGYFRPWSARVTDPGVTY